MGDTIRARVRGGMLEPIDGIELPEGKEVTVTIIDFPSERNPEAFDRSFGSWKGTLDAEALIRGIRESRRVSTRPEPRL
ncbi:MAG: antitoxin family protein [Candidatus Rokuibacteriota bacterium]